VNAFNRRMLDETVAAVKTLHADDAVRVIVLGSTNPDYFSAGADLESFRDMDAVGMQKWVDVCHHLADALRSGPKPVLACIRGVAVGGGLEMALHADRRFVAHDARLGQPEINIAFVPPVAGTQALVRLIGRSAAFRMLSTGMLVDADAALNMGLVDEAHEPEELEPAVQAFGEVLAAKPANALASIRRCLADGGDASWKEGLAVEAREAVALAGHPNFGEGIAAFLARRPPVWKR
jgi:enoyl-CoA hydratase/carnithine racemase